MSEPIAIRRTLPSVQRDVPRGGEYFLCRADHRRADSWDLDDALGRIPGRRGVLARSPYLWHAIPKTQLHRLQSLSVDGPGVLIVHDTE